MAEKVLFDNVVFVFTFISLSLVALRAVIVHTVFVPVDVMPEVVVRLSSPFCSKSHSRRLVDLHL
jgi:hypothetical protein